MIKIKESYYTSQKQQTKISKDVADLNNTINTPESELL